MATIDSQHPNVKIQPSPNTQLTFFSRLVQVPNPQCPIIAYDTSVLKSAQSIQRVFDTNQVFASEVRFHLPPANNNNVKSYSFSICVNTRPGNDLFKDWSPPLNLLFHVMKLQSIDYLGFNWNQTYYYPNVTEAFFTYTFPTINWQGDQATQMPPNKYKTLAWDSLA